MSGETDHGLKEYGRGDRVEFTCPGCDSIVEADFEPGDNRIGARTYIIDEELHEHCGVSSERFHELAYEAYNSMEEEAYYYASMWRAEMMRDDY